MRKFAPSILLDHPENDCTYAAGYLESEHLFLAQLTITNNGKLLQPRGKWTAYPPPFNPGFLEWEYKVDLTTNFGGITFPLSATLKRYTMKSNARDCTDLLVDTEVKLSVTRFTPGLREPAFDAPAELMAIDQRPTGLPPGVAVNHTVTGDVWSSVADPQMARLTKLYKQSVRREPPKRSRTLILVALAATVIIPGFLLLRRWKKQRN